MSIEQLNQYKRVFGLSYSLNLEAGLLQDRLGIKFTEEPRKVLISRRNRAALLANALLLPHRNITLLRYALELSTITDGTIAGTYDGDYNLIFVKDNIPLSLTNLHENMHAFTQQTNPGYLQTGVDAAEEVVKAKMNRLPHPQDHAERMWLVKIIDEGFAQTGALYIRTDKDKQVSQANSEKYNWRAAIKYRADDIELATVQVLNEVFADKTKIEILVRGFMTRALKYEPVDWDNIVTYFKLTTAGVYFCQSVVDELLRGGLTTGDAFTSLIKNPPTKLAQLTEPEKFVQNIL